MSGVQMCHASEKRQAEHKRAPPPNLETVLVMSATVCLSLLSPSGPANAQSANIKGTSGYLSEWELSGRADTVSSRQGRSLSGVITMTHTGICSQEGPLKRDAEFRAKIVDARSSAHIDGSLVLDGAVCRFSGQLLGRFIGAMDCSNAKGVPIAFTIE